MGASIVRIDDVEWDVNVHNTLVELDLWGVKPLIPMIEATGKKGEVSEEKAATQETPEASEGGHDETF